jgi:hypothetical protein
MEDVPRPEDEAGMGGGLVTLTRVVGKVDFFGRLTLSARPARGVGH